MLMGTFVSSSAVAMEVKCFWKFGMRTDLVLETMDQSKRGTSQMRGDGGYQTISADQFLPIPGSKKVKLHTDNSFGFYMGEGELFTNGNLQFKVSSGFAKGQIMAKYKCDKTSIDILNYIENKTKSSTTEPIKTAGDQTKSESYSLQCRFKFSSAEIYVTPDKCIAELGYGPMTLQRDGQKITWNECIKDSDLAGSGITREEFEATENEKFQAELLFLMNEKQNYFEGVRYSSLNPGMPENLPRLKKGWNSIATGKSSKGISMEFDSSRSDLNMQIDYVYAKFRGRCDKFDPSNYAIREFIELPDQGKTSPAGNTFANYTNEELCENVMLYGGDEAKAEATKRDLNCAAKFKRTVTNPTPATSTSKLDKAKSTCTELGFTLGTEKHGDCVLKMLDN